MQIHFQNVTKRFGKRAVVRHLNLEIEEGEFLVLLGPSGCGKTTTLRLLAGLEELSSGQILMGDKRIDRSPPGERDIAMVFQNYALYPHMSVADNIGYPLKVRKLPTEQRESEVLRVARLLEIDSHLAKQPKQLSGGQQQRVALARAVIRKPSVFLMDEPLSNLDARLRVKMRAELKQLQKRLGVTTVYVTHDQAEAMTLADRIAVMRDGELEQLGPPMTLYQTPETAFVAAFIGSPQMNLLRGHLTSQGFRIGEQLFVGLPDQERIAEQTEGEMLLGFRPHRVSTARTGDGALLRGNIVTTEELGAERFILVDVEGTLVTVRADPDSDLPEENIHLRIQECHWFDAASENRIHSDRGTA